MIRYLSSFPPVIIRRTSFGKRRIQVIAQRRFQTHDPDIENPNVESIAKEKRKFETEIKKTLKGKGTTIPEVPGWNEKIASNSESIVKAERASNKDFQQLQKETIDRIQKKEFEKHPPPESTTEDGQWERIWKNRPKSGKSKVNT